MRPLARGTYVALLHSTCMLDWIASLRRYRRIEMIVVLRKMWLATILCYCTQHIVFYIGDIICTVYTCVWETACQRNVCRIACDCVHAMRQYTPMVYTTHIRMDWRRHAAHTITLHDERIYAYFVLRPTAIFGNNETERKRNARTRPKWKGKNKDPFCCRPFLSYLQSKFARSALPEWRAQ